MKRGQGYPVHQHPSQSHVHGHPGTGATVVVNPAYPPAPVVMAPVFVPPPVYHPNSMFHHSPYHAQQHHVHQHQHQHHHDSGTHYHGH